MKHYLIFISILVLMINFSSAAHFIVGSVNDSVDGTSANNRIIVLWSTSGGLSDNITDVIGSNGNSGADNVYMLDCDLLISGCTVGDVINVKVIDSGDGYLSANMSAIVTGAGFDIMNGLVLDSPPVFLNITVDDNFIIPPNEIDLNAGSTKEVKCMAILRDYENNSFTINSSFFDNSISTFYGVDDNNFHYSNSSCFINSSYAINQSYIECGFKIWYYANSGNWNCTMKAVDELNAMRFNSNTTSINKLLAISLPNNIDYGIVTGLTVSNESAINISNYGNSQLNLSLEGYAVSQYDNLSMNCTLGAVKNISIYYEKYNLTGSNNSVLSIEQFNSIYNNLTSYSVFKRFNLTFRQNDLIDDSIKPTYWRIYVPQGVAGSCSGNIIFGATLSPGN